MASKRVKVPTSFRIEPETVPNREGIFLQKLHLDEQDGFQTAQVKAWIEIDSQQLRDIGFELIEREQGCGIRFWSSPYRYSRYSNRVGEILEGQWGQVRSNARLSTWEMGWIYEEYTYNLYYGNSPKLDGLIDAIIPTVKYDNRVDLYYRSRE